MNGSLTDISFSNQPFQYASSINNAGQVTGGGGPDYHTFLWQNGNVQELGSPNGGVNPNVGRAINDAGVIAVASSYFGTNPYTSNSYLWNGAWQLLPTLGGPASGVVHRPWGINNLNQVVGASTLPSGDIHPYFWSQSRGIHDLGTLGGHNGNAYGINFSGSVIGSSEITPLVSDTHAFIYSNGQMLDLNNLIPTGTGWVLTDASAINDKGYIVGSGTVNGKTHGYLLQPITRTISGSVTLEGVVNPAQMVSFTFRPTDGGPSFTRTATLNADKTFSLTGIPGNAYALHIKGDRWLAQNVSVDATNGDVSGVTATLGAGDANNDNSVDIADFGLLVGAYGSLLSDPTSGYDVRADLNDDGRVDVADFGLMVNNYGSVGDL